jgi:ATP-dependent RNA helicase RhlE
MGHKAAEIHSNLSLSQRKKSLGGFKSGVYRVLVATDIAARGIDVRDIALVVNYDLPDNPDDYVHRVGRTGRAGKGGQAISFITPDQRGKIRHLERLVRQTLKVSPVPQLPQPLPVEAERLVHSSEFHSARHAGRQRTRRGSGFRRERGRRQKRVSTRHGRSPARLHF